ncbi:hypothetical protein PTTG_27020 [Puccinia triticina 1-1 BBBD Race 1]|uniref:Actin-related protein 8 n=1 Tax=Puccinia triticina (isolate 1-1 / race 1 (BBBD)) TaxID=630390 RepID=A0A180GNK1_PUCT1|nr:hypothetical protein PTTG_27020 [Puccinia triticina 1-1 BBBD Race 1]
MPKGHPKEYIPAGPVGAPAAIAEPQASPFVFTGFQPLSTINGKNVASAFGKSEHQSWWTRRADDHTWEQQRYWKKAVMLGGDSSALLSSSTHAANPSSSSVDERTTNGDANKPKGYSYHYQADPAQRTIVIHPGSRTVQIGRASDPLPISIPNVVARRRRPSPIDNNSNSQSNSSRSADSSATSSPPPPPRPGRHSSPRRMPSAPSFAAACAPSSSEGSPMGMGIAANHNADAAPPLTLSEDQDPLGTVWPAVEGPESKELYIGHDALLIPEPDKHNYAVRWPILRGQLNSADDSGYLTKAEILADVEAVWLYALSTHLGIKEQDLKEYSAIFILPDIYDHVYLREMVDLLFRALGFKQICLQQESLCACFGAG